ncbi:MAG: hypothetical protein R3263_10130 [Myxococcota bacterium]|nr:hypothetical protein [Myxococcota bacterium]
MTKRAMGMGCLGALLLAACAGPAPEARWTKPGASAEDLERDRSHCLRVAEEAVPPGAGDREQVQRGGNAFLRCMRERGWTQTAE